MNVCGLERYTFRDYLYLDNDKDLLQVGDEFQEPLHYRTKGAGVTWDKIADTRAGGKPCKECRYRRKVK